MSTIAIDKATLDAELLEGCPSLAPRPNASSIKALEDHCVDVVTSYIAAEPNPPEFGYAGHIKSAAAYAIESPQPFVSVPNPGVVSPGTFSGHLETYKTQKRQYENETTINNAVKKLLSNNKVIPDSFRTMTRFNAAIDIKDIFAHLRTNYGQPTPQERTDMETKLNMPYDPSSKAIEVLFEEFKQVLLWSLDCGPVYTEDQIVQKLHDRIEQCGHISR